MLSVSADVAPEEWDSYVSMHPQSSLYHLWAWRRVFESAFGHRTEYLAARLSSGRLVGLLPLVVFDHWLCGRFMVSLPFVNGGGVIADDDAAAGALAQEATERARWHGCAHVEFRHRTPQFAELPASRPMVAMTLMLPRRAGDIWQRLDGTLRDEIRTAERRGLTAEVGTTALLDDFYAIFAGATRDRGTPAYPKRWFSEIMNRLPERTRVFVIRSGQDAVAGAVTLAAGSAMEVLSIAWRRPYRDMCPHTLIHWSIVRQAVEDGVRALELGSSKPGDGPARYRARWGATPRSTVSEYVRLSRRRLPRDRSKESWTQGAMALWRRMPLIAANALGPSLARYMP